MGQETDSLKKGDPTTSPLKVLGGILIEILLFIIFITINISNSFKSITLFGTTSIIYLIISISTVIIFKKKHMKYFYLGSLITMLFLISIVIGLLLLLGACSIILSGI